MKNDGGPAFPNIRTNPSGGILGDFGLSLRDYFAAAALTGMIANTSGRTIAVRVKHAWEYADAMLIEREKP